MSIREDIKKGIACDSVGSPHSVLGRTVCLSVHPGKMLLFPLLSWFNRFYRGKYRFAHIVFTVDLLLILTILVLSVVSAWFWFLTPTDFSEQIQFEATVAPRAVISGAPSTLVIRYTNHSDETLRNPRVHLTFPEHFLLHGVETSNEIVEPTDISLPNIAPDDFGSVRIRGVMFGDVGGTQSLYSILTYTHGDEEDIQGQKLASFTFSPVDSALVLTANLPEQLLSYQPVEGSLSYKNTSTIPFPEIRIVPEWPESFQFTYTPSRFQDGAFVLPGVDPGEEKAVSFRGILGDAGDLSLFQFLPSFTFDEHSYSQSPLRIQVPIVPPALDVSLSTPQEPLIPGTTPSLTLSYTHTGEEPIYDVELFVESAHPLLPNETRATQTIDVIKPGETGEVTLSPTIDSHLTYIPASKDAVRTATLFPGTRYNLQPAHQPVKSLGEGTSFPMQTPVHLEAFARYTSPSGDQIGRGTLPPTVGEETTYWIFWRIGSTTTDLSNAVMTGHLPPNVRFTGRQSSSLGSGVSYDPEKQNVTWSLSEIPSTIFHPDILAAVAFEVGITPTESQVGTSPTLVEYTRFRATESDENQQVSRQTGPIKTRMPGDEIAGPYPTVVLE